nr:COP9 signalosome complex subunit 9 isoform X1 [Pongo pygmaeus]
MGPAPRLPAPRRANPGFSKHLVKGGDRPRREACALARGTRRRSLRVECLLGAPKAPGNTPVVRGVAFAAFRWLQHPHGGPRLTLNRIQNPEGFRLPSLGCDMIFPLPWSCGSGWSMMAARHQNLRGRAGGRQHRALDGLGSQ